MSLEQALADNTAAIHELIKITRQSMGLAQQIITAAQGGTTPTNTTEQTPVTGADIAADRREGESVADTKARLQKEGISETKKPAPDTASTPKSSQVSAPAAEQSSPETKTAAQPPAEAKKYDFESVGKLITKLAADTENRAKAVALLQRFGVKNLRPLENDPEALAKVGALAEKILAGEYDPRDAQAEA